MAKQAKEAEEAEPAEEADSSIETEAHVRSSEEGPDTTATLEPLTNASAEDWLGSNQDPDVLLSVPNLGVDRIKLIVDNVKADVELHAKVLDLVELHVGAKVSIDKVDLEIDNVRVQAMLKVRLDKVAEIVDRLLTALEHNPEILTGVVRELTSSSGTRQLESGSTKPDEPEDEYDEEYDDDLFEDVEDDEDTNHEEEK